MSGSQQTPPSTRSNRWLQIAIWVFIVLLILRMLAPMVVHYMVNRSLEDAQGITGSIGDVDLHIYRGAYEVEAITLYAVDVDQNKRPLLSINKLDISVLWSALLNGNIVTELTLSTPHVTIYDQEPSVTDEHDQVTNEQTWVGLANDLVVFSIDRVTIEQGKVSLINQSKQGDTETFVSELNGYVLNITNSQEREGSLVTEFAVEGKLMGESKLALHGGIDPFSQRPNFDLNAQIQRFSVEHLHNVITFYTPFDIEAGEIDGAIELLCKEGMLDGYVKAGIYDLSVFSWQEDVEKDGDGPFTILFEGIAELLGNIMENDDSQLVAAKVPVSGTLDNAEVSTFQAVLSVLDNAFTEAFKMNIENIISFDDGSQPTEQAADKNDA